MAPHSKPDPDAPLRQCLGGCKKMIPYAGPAHRLCTACNNRNSGYSRREARVSARPVDIRVPEIDRPAVDDLL